MSRDPSEDSRKSALRNQIDENLRRIYATAVDDAVPERFTQLLQKLRDSAPQATTKSQPEAQGDQTEAGPDGSASPPRHNGTRSGR